MKRRRPKTSNRRGAIFITVMGVMVILSALLLVFARNMSVESMAAANRIAASQADAVEQGAEQWVMANVEEYGNNTNGVDITTQLPAQAIQIGTGYFWIIRPNATSNQEYDFGIQDESSKININSASVAQLDLLPGMTPDIAQAIFDWRTATGNGGAEESYYESLPEPYESKGAKFDTVDELLLVDGVTPQLMYGSDVNRNGVIDPGEQTNGSLAVAFDSAADTSRGIVNFLTVYSRRPGATPTSFDTGRINVYTASEQTLMSLTDPNGNPILSQGDADTIIANRANNPEGTSYTQLFNSLTQAQRNLLSPPRGRPLVAAQTAQFSADIVAVSGDARAFKRVRIVVTVPPTSNPTSGTPTAKIVYRKDLTSLGWPLPQEVRDSMRKGQGIPADFAGTGVTGMNSSLTP
jgi:DNA uptake protein ComE-like DNA-binding protein